MWPTQAVQEYGGNYPTGPGDTLVFGAQGIAVDDGASFMIDEADLEWDGDFLATPPPPPPKSETLAIEQLPFNPVYLMIVDDLELSIRAANCLRNDNIRYIGDLVQKTDIEMLRSRIGRKSLNEIKEVLAGMGLHLGVELPGWPPNNIEELAKAYAARVDS